MYSPRARYQMDAAIVANRETRFNAVAQANTAFLGK
jgi:hypothetical protein